MPPRSCISVISIDTNCTQEVCQGKRLRRLSTQAASSTPGGLTSTGDSAPVYLCPRYSSAAVPAICMPSATMADDASAPPTATPLGASLSTSGALHEGTAVRRVAACTGSGRAHGRRSTVAWWSADDGQAISTAATHNAWRMKEVQKGPNRRTRPARSQDFRRHGGGHNTRTSRAASDKTQPHSRSRDHI